MSYGDNTGYDRFAGEGLIPSASADSSPLKNPFSTTTPPDVYKYIWLSFNSLPDKDKANPTIRRSAENDETLGLSSNYKNDFYSDKKFKEINSYEKWLKVFDKAQELPVDWSYTKWRIFDRGGGSRRSLQTSRFLKRKSRKYKSIKKSKKRSFKKRSGRH